MAGTRWLSSLCVVAVLSINVLLTSSLSPTSESFKTRINSMLPWQAEGPIPLRENCGYSVVITGGTRGVGLAMAKEFLSFGDSVVICGRDPERLEKAVAMLKTKFPSNTGAENVFGITADVSSYGDVINLGKLKFFDPFLVSSFLISTLKRSCIKTGPTYFSTLFVSKGKFAKEKLGKNIHYWINNAGSVAYKRKSIIDLEAEDLKQVVETNMLGTMYCCKVAIDLMKTQPEKGTSTQGYC